MKFELPHDDAKLSTTADKDLSISAEQLEVKNKMLRLYEKAILANDFETADTLDTCSGPLS